MKNINTKYDIFISYRRSSYDTANLIATKLKSAGYSVFFDLESLRSGKFNEQLYKVIENCKDFISVLPPNALDRCVNEDDWVRLEICHAMKYNKNIIPVMLNGFTWPDPMPSGMEELCNYHALTSSSVEHFDMAMESLQRKYLTSKPHIATKIMAKKTGIFAVALVAILAVLYGVFMLLSKDVCQYYAVKLVNDATAVHVIAEENSKLKDYWDEFVVEMKYEKKAERKSVLQQSMLDRINLTEKNVKTAWKDEAEEMQIGAYHSFLLSLHGISSQEIAISPMYADLIYTDYIDQLEMLRNAVNDPSSLNIRMGNVLLDIFVHSSNSFYVALLAELSDFPKYSLNAYNQLSPMWYHYPKQYKLGEKESYYEDIINTETRLTEEKLSRFENMVEQQEAELEDIERKLDEMQENWDKELAAVENNIYNEFKQNNTILESDNQWYQWGKIARWGYYLELKLNDKKENMEQGIDYVSSITPDMVCDDIITQLSLYQKYHPESKAYVETVKAFYREMAKEKIDYAGVLVFAFQDNVEHSIFRIGDIIREYDGKKIKDLEDLNAAYRSNNAGSVKLLRLVNGNLEEITIPQIKDTDIVGFVGLTE